MSTTAEEILAILENEFDEPKCQSSHEADDGHIADTCSIRVVARKSLKCDGVTFNICYNSLLYNLECIADYRYLCECEERCRDCWTIEPY